MRVLLLLVSLFAIAFAVAPGEVDYSTNRVIKSPLLDLPNKVADEDTTASYFSNPTNADDLLKEDYESLTGFSYNHATAFKMATVSAAAYCTSYGTSSLGKWTCAHCKASKLSASDIQSFQISGSDTWGFVGVVWEQSNAKTIIVSWRGTKSWENWITNLATNKVAYKGCSGCEVHSGFYNAYVSARTKVVDLVTKLQNKYGSNTPIMITGHSLGGALASHNIIDFYNHVFSVSQLGDMTIVSGGHPAYDTDAATLTPTQVSQLGGSTLTASFALSFPMYTFGQPRVGNSKFSAWVASTMSGTRIYRLTHHRDPVPHVPPSAMGFNHPPSEVFYNEDSSSYKTCSSSNGEDPNCSNQYTFTLSIKDHGVYAGYKFDSSSTACP